ncbi:MULTISPECIES: helix-turn-helix domain-containing protein [unclassified Paenibacillus]|uniref:helix-turn-helix domain-containing protein n=1 Tax=unclassified Paenibacillus TaxID=185978 RepID=UPI0024BB3ACC|nr:MULTISPECIES: helix-turn-helix transcriptional regulator [unclassified Paenibacillus]
MQSIYQRIEELIKERGMTKKAFCEQLGISTGNFGDWKRGKTTPGTNKLIEIASFFNASLDWIMLGRNVQGEALRESRDPYFFGVSGQLDCQGESLSEVEKDFILEYIEFTRFRKEKRQEGSTTE